MSQLYEYKKGQTVVIQHPYSARHHSPAQISKKILATPCFVDKKKKTIKDVTEKPQWIGGVLIKTQDVHFLRMEAIAKMDFSVNLTIKQDVEAEA